MSPFCPLMVPALMTIIDPDLFTLSYSSVDDSFMIVNSLGAGTLMSKINLKNAFHLIPVRPMIGICLECNGRKSFMQTPSFHSACAQHHFYSANCSQLSTGYCSKNLLSAICYIILMTSLLLAHPLLQNILITSILCSHSVRSSIAYSTAID